MSLRNLPAAPAVSARPGVQCDLSPKALEAWNPDLRAATRSSDTSITIYEPIGYDWWTGEGVTAKRIAGALRAIGSGKDVDVYINSPGGDVFEGLAIYNLLREHEGKVTVHIMGLAASAASFLAMAGDEIRIARAGFIMIHNAWVIAMGNRHELREVANWLEPFDRAILDIYQSRTGIDAEEIAALMDSESWIGGADAVDDGWADGFLASDIITESPANRSEFVIASRRLDAAMARAGIPRSERRNLMNEFKSSMRNAAGGSPAPTDTPSAVAPDLSASVNEAIRILQSLHGADNG